MFSCLQYLCFNVVETGRAKVMLTKSESGRNDRNKWHIVYYNYCERDFSSNRRLHGAFMYFLFQTKFRQTGNTYLLLITTIVSFKRRVSTSTLLSLSNNSPWASNDKCWICMSVTKFWGGDREWCMDKARHKLGNTMYYTSKYRYFILCRQFFSEITNYQASIFFI